MLGSFTRLPAGVRCADSLFGELHKGGQLQGELWVRGLDYHIGVRNVMGEGGDCFSSGVGCEGVEIFVYNVEGEDRR